MRNLLWTGNPFFPLFDGVFNPQNPYEASTLHPFVTRKLIYKENLAEILLVPLRIFWQGQDDVPALFDGRLNPGLLLLPLGLLLRSSKNHGSRSFELRLWFIFALLFILVAFFTRDMRVRYLAPALPPLVILATFGLHGLMARCQRMPSVRAGKTGQIAILVGVGGMLLMNAGYVAGLFTKVAPLDYLGGKVTRAAYIQHFRPEYAAVQAANQHLQGEDRVLCLFLGNRRYYLQSPSTFWDWPQFLTAVQTAADPRAMADRLRSQGITHVLMGEDRVDSWATRTMSDADRHKIKGLRNDYMEILFEKGGYSLYRLKAAPAGKG